MIGAALATRLHLGLALALWSLALVGLLARLVVQRPETIRERANIAPEAARHTLSTVLQAVTDALDMPAVILRADGMILQQNEAADRSFGHLSDGMHVSARWRSPSILDMIRDTVATGLPNQVEHSERLPSERVYITRIAPVVMPQGAVADEPLYLLSFKDISELRRLDRMRSDFVANASHELRTPLASLRGFLETLQGPAKNDPKAQERFIVIMLDQANRMSRLVDDLLSLSRLEMKAHLAPEDKVDLVSLLGHVRDSLQPLAEEMDVELSLDLPDGPALVLGDRDELVQVFENLIENACKYGQDGKRVDVGVKAISGKAVEVSVVDYGPGIPPEHVPRLTERFYRVSLADSRSKKGTGLGLAIVKHILTRHRARLIIKSEPGAKTEFTVRF
ncbi:phosphate regulon sensor histidine kinase PhoR [Rhizobium halophytocola]